MSAPQYTPAMLIEAEAALHSLMVGTAVVEVTDQNGERVRFTQANQYRLQVYINTMRAALCPPTAPAANPNAPLGFFF